MQNDMQKAYEEKPSKFELVEGDLYQVYVLRDGKDVPYVVVNCRTGYFHG